MYAQNSARRKREQLFVQKMRLFFFPPLPTLLYHLQNVRNGEKECAFEVKLA